MAPESAPDQEPPPEAAEGQAEEWQAEEPLAVPSETPPPARDFIIEVAQPVDATAEVEPPPAWVPAESPPAEAAMALEPEPESAPPKESRPCLDTIVEPTLVPHGRPFMLSATFLDPPPERPPLQSATIVEPMEAMPTQADQAQPCPSEPPPAPVSADGTTLIMPIEEIGEIPPERESRPQLYTLPLDHFEEEVSTSGPVPTAGPSASGSLTPLELAIVDDPVNLPVQRVRPAIAAMVAAAITAALFMLFMDRPAVNRAQAGVPLPFAMVMSCEADEADEPVVTSDRGLKIDDDEQKAATEIADEEPGETIRSAPAVKSKARSKKTAKAKARGKTKTRGKAKARGKTRARGKTKARRPKAKTKAKRPKAKSKAKRPKARSKARRPKAKRPKKRTGAFMAQLPLDKSKTKKARRKSVKRPRGKKRR